MVFENSSKVSSAFLITRFFYQKAQEKERNHWTAQTWFMWIWELAKKPPTLSITLSFCSSSNWASSRSPWKNKNITKILVKMSITLVRWRNHCCLKDQNCVAHLAQGLPLLVPLLLKVFQLRKDDQSFRIASESEILQLWQKKSI